MAIPIPSEVVRKTMPRALERTTSSSRSKGLLKDQLELVETRKDGKTRYSIKPIEDKLSFDKGFYVFIRAIQLLTSRNTGTIVIGLAGPSGAGKTVFSHKVQSFIPGCALLSMDNYNDATRLIDGNFDDPRLTDYDLLLENLKALKAGEAAQVPIYDFRQSRRVGYHTVEVPSSRVVMVEGIYALSTKIRGILDLGVSINGGVHFDLVKRVLRDIDRSGQEPTDIIQQISDTVYPMYKAFIEPDLKQAHLRIYNTFNPFSGFMNATYILKSAHHVTPEAIRKVLPGAKENADLETYDIYLLPPNEDPETCASWLRMRTRDGRYQLMFEEWVVEGPFIITPRISFEVSVRILGGLMALGYEIGSIMKRTSTVFSDGQVCVKLDSIEGMKQSFVQVQGKDREQVGNIGRQLGLDGTYIPRSYIEQIQLEKLTATFQTVPEDVRRRFAVDGEPLLEDGGAIGRSPKLGASFSRHTGFDIPMRPSLASSAPPSRTSSGQIGLLIDDVLTASQGGMRSTRVDKMERLLEGVSERVDTLSLVPDMTTSRLEAQLKALLKQQTATVAHLQQLQSDVARHQKSSDPAATTAGMQNVAAGVAIGATVGMALGFGVAYFAALRH
ncbi:hypothetical protein WJX73_005883 [Symbiochloris irregularis]|uniref:CYTH domain-containing protein n=1 Tax=Symbiochloris irregularis TaxID=706552 RepID=A0AAW1P017_9CHLO